MFGEKAAGTALLHGRLTKLWTVVERHTIRLFHI
jgi:hypothetical protein